MRADAGGIGIREPVVPFGHGAYALTTVIDGEPAGELIANEIMAPVPQAPVPINSAESGC
ncbi:hypothetical protein [Burkholderia ubonensis]|uniref:hypothetical protein n=1 Tax=Burkholderia ubonensis TaxID=101571 RepID=UPI000757C283|nr:hypothetical protein [Burkholderia ubonensis]KVZ67511.1 hypothetical protein WL19_21525 [Burkholderia ubonensis]KVZ93429.1 hypothetical protein WL24_30105 [Burkholderia ubonensis]